jgi:hypothetical protein
MNYRQISIGILTCFGFGFVIVVTASGQSIDPYSSITSEQKAIFQPGIQRYVKDQISQNWNDLWEIQDQTSDLKNEILEGNRAAPDLTRKDFIVAMKETVGTGLPRLRQFTLEVVRPDKDAFIVIGCGKATRESWHQTGTVIFAARIEDGKPKFDIWGMTSDSCSK